MRSWPVVLLCIATAVALASEALATDYPVFASQLTMRSRNGKGSLHLVLPLPIAPPEPGSGDDPSLGGLTLTVVSRGTGETATFHAPPGSGENSWKVRGTPSVVYTYRDGLAGPGDVQAFAMRKLSLRLGTRDAGLSLNGAVDPVAVRVSFGSIRICALFSGARESAGFFTDRSGSAAALADCDDATLAGVP